MRRDRVSSSLCVEESLPPNRVERSVGDVPDRRMHLPAGATQYAGSIAFQAVKEADVDAALCERIS